MILSKSYKEVINKIHVDDAMKQRILQRIYFIISSIKNYQYVQR